MASASKKEIREALERENSYKRRGKEEQEKNENRRRDMRNLPLFSVVHVGLMYKVLFWEMSHLCLLLYR